MPHSTFYFNFFQQRGPAEVPIKALYISIESALIPTELKKEGLSFAHQGVVIQFRKSLISAALILLPVPGEVV
jgi:hypothetical protein